MGSNRSLLYLTSAAALLIVANMVLDFGGVADSGKLFGKSLLPVADRADSISIVREGEKGVGLERNGEWRIVSPFSAEANQMLIARLTDALAFGRPDDVMSEAELLKLGRTRADFLPPVPSLEVSVVADSVTNTVQFGYRTPSGDGVYAMVNGTSPVFVVPTGLVAAVDLQLDCLRQGAICPFGVDEIASFDVKRGNGEFLRFEKKKSGWELSGERTIAGSAERIEAFLAKLVKAEASAFVWPVGASGEPKSATASLLSGYGLDAENPVGVVFHSTDGRDIGVQLGKDSPDGNRYALVRNARSIVTLDAKLCRAFEVDIEDLADSRIWPLEASAVSTISITDGAVGYLLARDEKYGWRFDAPVSAPADAAKVSELLGRLIRMQKSECSEKGLQVSLVANSAPVTVDREAVLAGMSFEDLRSRSVVRIAPSSVKRITLDSVSVVWDPEARIWKIENSDQAGVVKSEAVSSLLAALDPLEAVTVVRLSVPVAGAVEYGLDHPRHTLAIDSNEANVLRKNILIGRETEAGSFATVGASDAVFFLNRETVLRLTSALTVGE